MRRKHQEVTVEEYKTVVLNLMKRIHKICVENNIRYTIAFGTLLGAVRHGGFIPWDDDIDICMPREDYEKFVNAFVSEDGRYYILDSNVSKNYFNNMSRACDGSVFLEMKQSLNVENIGAYIDIFVMDRWPEDEGEREQFRCELRTALRNVKYALPLKIYKTEKFKYKVKLLLRLKERIKNRKVGLEQRKRERDQVMMKYNHLDTGWRSFSFGSPNRIVWFVREEDLDKRVLMKFEDTEVYAPADYDRLLTERFGDYMKLPPVEQRKSNHHFIPYWRNK